MWKLNQNIIKHPGPNQDFQSSTLEKLPQTDKRVRRRIDYYHFSSRFQRKMLLISPNNLHNNIRDVVYVH